MAFEQCLFRVYNKSMKRRVFVAIPIPEKIKKEVGQWQRAHGALPVRWLKPENLHITIVPPWYVDEDQLYTVTKTWQTVKDLAPFPIKFTQVLFGPPGQPPRLVWAEGETPKEFVKLKERLEEALLENEKTGFFKKEKRPAKLHLTLARFRPGSIKKLPHLGGAVDWRFDVDSVNLMESILKRTGAEYTTLQHVSLGEVDT